FKARKHKLAYKAGVALCSPGSAECIGDSDAETSHNCYAIRPVRLIELPNPQRFLHGFDCSCQTSNGSDVLSFLALIQELAQLLHMSAQFLHRRVVIELNRNRNRAN